MSSIKNVSLGAMARWLTVPWRRFGVAAALIGAAVVPAFLVSAAGIWRVAAGDRIAERLVEIAPPSDATLTVRSNAYLAADGVTAANQAVSVRMGEIDGIGPAVRTLSTPRGLAGSRIGTPAFNVPVRLVNRPGAIETIDYVRHLPDEFEGAWISSWMAQRFDIQLGDPLIYYSDAEPEVAGAEVAPGGGDVAEMLVVGIYEPLWTVDGSAPETDRIGVDVPAFRAAMPPELIPSWSSPFRAPTFSLVFVDDGVMADLGVTATARWDGDLESLPTTREELTALVADYRRLERALVQDPVLTTSLDRLARIEPPTPAVDSTLPATRGLVELAVGRLDQPMTSALWAGIAVGLFVMASSAWFAVDARRQEYRLLGGEGDRWNRFAARSAAQLLAPTMLGSAFGVGGAMLFAWTVGPPGDTIGPQAAWESIDLVSVVVVAVAGIGAASLLTGWLGQAALAGGRLDRQPPAVTFGFAAAAALGLGFLWLQVGTDAGPGATLDLSVVALPLVALLVAVGLALGVLAAVTRRWSTPVSALPTVLFLAWRRATRHEAGSRLVIGGLAIAIGLTGFSTLLVDALERNVDRKLVSDLGAETKVDLIGRPPESLALPANSSIVGFERTRVMPGNREVRVVAIDPLTAGTAIDWPDDFSITFPEAVALLESDAGDDIPAIELIGDTLPTTGSFGLTQPFRYRIVGAVESVPLAAGRGQTLLVSAARLDDDAFERFMARADGTIGAEDRTAADDTVETTAAGFVPPTSRYRQNLVSRQSNSTIEAFLAENEVRFRSIESASERRADVDLVGPDYAFDYLRLLGMLSGLAAIASLLLNLSSQRRTRALGALMMQRMGLSATRTAMVTTIEVVVLATVGLVTAGLCAPVVVRRLLPRFDPSPDIPPAATLDVPIVSAATVALAVIVAVGGLVFVVERLGQASRQGSVLRDGD